jgi:hypothetical protein
MNDLDPTNALKIQKLELGVRKLGGNDIKWSNLCGDQVTHFVGYSKRFNVKNFYDNHKKTRTTFDANPIMCVSSTNERKTQAGWVIVVGQRVKR